MNGLSTGSPAFLHVVEIPKHILQAPHIFICNIELCKINYYIYYYYCYYISIQTLELQISEKCFYAQFFSLY